MSGRATRRQALRTVFAGAAAAGAMALVDEHDHDASAAGPSAEMDATILQVFLELENAQRRFYEQALRTARLTGELRTLAQTVSAQEAKHVALLERHLGGRAQTRAASDVAEAVSSPEAFTTHAIDLEEAVIAAYVGQGANLTRNGVVAITPMVSVEARQVAWLRDVAGVIPAPRAADPARPLDDVVAELRTKGLLS